MSSLNAFVDNISSLSPSSETLAAAPSETVPQTITVSFQGGRVGLLSTSHPRGLAWAKRIEFWKQRDLPVYVEIDPDTHTIIDLLVPEISMVQDLTPDDNGDIHVRLIPSPAPHYLLHVNPDFESMRKLLESAKAGGTAILVTTARTTHEIIDVRPYDKAPDLKPLAAPLPGPAEAPPTPVTEQRAQELFNLMNARSCDCSVVPPCIPFKYPTDGCYARAHEMCRLMFVEGEQPNKVWIYASSDSKLNPDAPNDPDCQVSWWYHVAPTLLVSTASGLNDLVIDPSLCTGPVTQDAWKALQKDPGATLTPTDARPFWPNGTPDDTYSLTIQYLQARRDDLEDQCLFYGPPPYSCPIVKNCFFIVDRSTFGEDEIAARLVQGNPAVIQAAFYVVVDGFTPQELGITANTFVDPPNVKPALGIVPPVAGMSIKAVHLAAQYPGFLGRRQRLTWVCQVEFTGTAGFVLDSQTVSLTASIDTVSASASVQLIKQPNPYEIDGAVSWLSTDLRVFQIKPGDPKKFDVNMGNTPAAAPAFIQAVINNLNSGNTGGQTFENDLPTDYQTSNLELSEKVLVNGTPTPVFNFAVARVRYRAKIKQAENVRVFFRLFPASTTSLAFNASTTYRHGGAGSDVVPLLGIQGNEVATIPCFATARVNSLTDSLNQQKDLPNVQTLPADATGTEVVRYFGCWLDINQSSQPQFPIQPSPTDGPFTTGRKTIQELIRGKHQCLVAEIAFDPDPIPSNATPGSSDKLAQRNLSIVESANPGDLASHRIPQTFEIRPTRVNLKPGEIPDELMIDWGNVPAGSLATFYLPGVSTSEILKLAVGLYRSHNFVLIDDQTLRCPTDGITYMPIPSGVGTNLAGMISVDLPSTVLKGQVYTIVIRQVTGGFEEVPVEPNLTEAGVKVPVAGTIRTWRRILGSFQITIPVLTKGVMLAPEERLLSNLRWIQLAIPQGNRWHPVFGRYVGQIANRVDALGGDSSKIKPSPSGEWQGIDPKQCTTLAFMTAALLGLLLIVLGALGGGWQATIGIIVFALLIGVGYFWVKKCQPIECALLRTLVAGAGSGSTVLAVLALVGVSTPQLVTILALSMVITGLTAFLGWVRHCY